MRTAISVLLEKAASLIFLVLLPWAATLSMTKNSVAWRTILARKLLVNTCVLKQIVLWCTDLVSQISDVFARWNAEKPAVLSYVFLVASIFHQKGPKLENVHVGFGPPFSTRQFLGKRHLRFHKQREKKEAHNETEPGLREDPVTVVI